MAQIFRTATDTGRTRETWLEGGAVFVSLNMGFPTRHTGTASGRWRTTPRCP